MSRCSNYWQVVSTWVVIKKVIKLITILGGQVDVTGQGASWPHLQLHSLTAIDKPKRGQMPQDEPIQWIKGIYVHDRKGNRQKPDSDSEVLVESFQAGNCIKIPYIVWNWECTFTFLKIDFDWGLKLNSPQNKLTFKLKMFSKVTFWRTSVHSCFSFC